MDPALFPANDYERERRIVVLHVSDFSASYPGAFIRQLLELDLALASTSNSACAFAFPKAAESTEWFRQLRAKRYPVFTIPNSVRFDDKYAAKALVSVINDVDAPIVHCHFGTYDGSVVKAVEKGAKSRKILWHYRTALEVPVSRRSIARKLKDRIRYRNYRDRIDGCIGISQGVCDEAEARGLDGKVQLVRPGIDVEQNSFNETARHRVRRELGLAAGEVMVLHLGWHWHRKGGDLLADAMNELEEVGVTGVVAYSAGAPENVDMGSVKRLAPRDNIAELYAASDIFVSASRSEAWGNGLAEAMACERVSVAPLVDGQSEIFLGAEGCMPIPPDDAGSLAAAIGRLIERRDSWAELGKANRQHIVERFDVARWASDMVSVYGDLIDLTLHVAPEPYVAVTSDESTQERAA